jgi:hypothetical protein
MRTRIAVALGALAAVALSVIAFRAVVDRPPTQAPRAQQTPDCLTLARACPEVLPSVMLHARWQESRLSLLLVPPPAGVDPAIGAVRAIDIAWRGGGLVGGSQQAILSWPRKGISSRRTRWCG